MKDNNKKYLKIIIGVLIIIEFLTLFLALNSRRVYKLDEVKLLNNNRKDMIAVYTRVGNREYALSNDNSFPASGYSLNNDKSGCTDVNGNNLNIDITYSNGAVLIKTKKQVFCYLYFDAPYLTETGTSSVTFSGFGTDLLDYKIYGNSDQTRLPEEYQEVEYIQGTGTQFIDTGYIGNLESDIEVTIMKLQASTNNTFSNFGYCGTYIQPNISMNSSSRNTRFGNKTVSTTNAFGLNTKATIRINKTNLTINGVSKGTFNTTTAFTTPGNIAIGQCTNGLGINYFDGVTNYYGGKIYDDGVLVRNFIPCYRKSDNEVGMYDLVNGVFYTNAGTGSFVAGSDIVSVPEPNNPVEIKSVGDKTKNLFDPSNMQSGNISTQSGTPSSSSSSTRSIDFIEVKPSTNYAWTIEGNVRVHFYNSEHTWLSSIAITASKRYITTPSNCAYIKITKSTPLATMKTYDIQMEEGSTVTDYEPYGYKIPVTVGSNTVNIYLDEPLRKVGDYADYVDFANGKVVRYIKKYTVTGTETIGTRETTTSGLYCFSYKFSDIGMTDILDYDSITGMVPYPKFMSNYFAMKQTPATDDVFYDINAGEIGANNYSATDYNRYFILSASGYTTDTDFKTWLASLYSAKTPVEVHYILETPTEQNIELPDITTNNGSTTITIGTTIKPSNFYVKYS